MKRRKFERLVEKALAGLPPEFASRLENVEVCIEDEPTPEQLEYAGMGPDDTLFGLYEGIPLTERTQDYNLVIPDKITIFRKPIEAQCASDEEIAEEIRLTVMHEIAHFFGISDEKMDEIETRWYGRDRRP
ncbi:MAG: metallopeptidase family protein [Dehalococcoidia bacterium]|nr:metallopeptidase family protein [Dehalococcoidia bacterium]